MNQTTRLLLSLLSLFFAAATPADEEVSLLLKWDHEFQFAGYYAANWQGFYDERGLKVTMQTRVQADQQLLDVQQEVLAGNATFGIGDGVALLKARSEGKPIVVLAALFQENPYAFYSLKERGITTPTKLRGMRVGIKDDVFSDVLLTQLLRQLGMHEEMVTHVPFYTDFTHLLNGDLDVLPMYRVSAEWAAHEHGVALNEIRLADYGIDYYGDVLFTRQEVVERQPGLVLDFVEASMTGWHYAMEHREELVTRISSELPRQLALQDAAGYNRLSAERFARLMHYHVAEPGQMSPQHWHHMQEQLREIGLLNRQVELEQFIFDREQWQQQRLERRSLVYGMALLLLLGLFTALLWRYTVLRQRNREGVRMAQQLRALLEANPDAMLAVSRTGEIRFANQATERLFGYTQQELIGTPIEKLVPARFAQRHSELREAFTAAARSRLAPHEKRGTDDSPALYALHRDGTEIPTEIHLNTLQGDEPLTLASIRNISERLSEEEQRRHLEQQMLHIQKLEAIGQLTGGIAHDFNNLLASILGNTELLELQCRKQGEERYNRYATEIRRAGERGRDLVRQLLAFCRGDEQPPQITNVQMILRETLELLRPTIPASIEIINQIEEQAIYLQIEPIKLEQALINLIINARDAIGGRAGRITITTRQVHDHSLSCNSCYQHIRGDFAIITVEDSGSGISEEQLHRIFEPFYTTKGVGKGSGMGLSMVHGIIHSAQGHIRLTSHPGEGSRFELLLPLAAAPAADA